MSFYPPANEYGAQNGDPQWDGMSPVDSPQQVPEAPLIVDLPAGQKLLIGELPEGTTIEVAAWSGTARPDNRTSRLLLGVSRSTETASSEAVVTDDYVAKRMLRLQKEQNDRKRRRRWIVVLGVFLAVVVAGLILALSPLTFIHPDSGQSLGFGPARSVVAVVVADHEISAGTTIVAVADSGKPVIGRVAATSATTVLIQTDTGYTQIDKAEVRGNVVMVIPFIGYLL